MSAQEQNISALEQKISAQEQKNVEQEQEISSMETANSDQQQMTDTLNRTLEEVKHVETGIIWCANSEMHNGGTSDRRNNVSRIFNRPYSRPPIVFVSVNYLQGHQSHDDTWYTVQVFSVSETQFTVMCVASGASQIRYMFVDYLVIPQL